MRAEFIAQGARQIIHEELFPNNISPSKNRAARGEPRFGQKDHRAPTHPQHARHLVHRAVTLDVFDHFVAGESGQTLKQEAEGFTGVDDLIRIDFGFAGALRNHIPIRSHSRRGLTAFLYTFPPRKPLSSTRPWMRSPANFTIISQAALLPVAPYIGRFSAQCGLGQISLYHESRLVKSKRANKQKAKSGKVIGSFGD